MTDTTLPPVPAEALESIARRVVEQSPRYATAVWPDVPDAEARDAELVAFLLADPRFVLTATAALAAGARLADDAICWDLTCLNCADRLNRLYEERATGYEEGVAAGEARGRTAEAADPEPSHAKCGCPVTVERLRMTTHTSACSRIQNTTAAADRLNSMIARGAKTDDRS